jgi:hypothetical protein
MKFLIILLITFGIGFGFNLYAERSNGENVVKSEMAQACQNGTASTAIGVNAKDIKLYCSNQKIVGLYRYIGVAALLIAVSLFYYTLSTVLRKVRDAKKALKDAARKRKEEERAKRKGLVK